MPPRCRLRVKQNAVGDYCNHEPDMDTIMYGLRSKDTHAICKRCGGLIYRWSEEHIDERNVRHPVVWALLNG